MTKRRANQKGKQANNNSDEDIEAESSAPGADTDMTADGDAQEAEAGAEATEPSTTAASQGTTDPPPPQQQQQPPYSDLILTSESRRGIYECDYCHSDISQLPRIRCAVCVDFDLCLECFLISTTATSVLSTHNARTHGYRVCDSTRYPLFPPVAASTNNVTMAVAGSNNLNARLAAAAAPALPGSSASSTTAPAATLKDANQTKVKEGNDDMEGVEVETGTIKINDQAIEIDVQNDNAQTQTMDKSHSAVSAAQAPSNASEPFQPPASQSALSRQTSSVSAVSAGDDGTATGAFGMAATASTYNIGESVVFTDPKVVWTVEEDLRLLEGIRKHGLGNWTDVADAVAGQGSVGKTPKRCMERYLDGFLGRYGYILPPIALEMASSDQENKSISGEQEEGNDEKDLDADLTTLENQEKRSSKRRAAFLRSPSGVASASSMTSKKRFKTVATDSMDRFNSTLWKNPFLPNNDVQIGQDVGRDQAYKAEQLFVKTIAPLEKVEDVEKVRKEWEDRVGKPGGPTVLPMRVEDLATLPGSEILGFMPRRGDFDIEYENEAEQVVADMEFISGEPAADRELKLKVLAIYNSKLDEREKRKRFVLSRGLYNYRKNQIEEQNLPRDERDLIHRMRLFERFHTPEEHEQFLADLLKAKRLRKEIAKLQTYRRLGIRTLAEAEQYEIFKARRAFHTTAALQKEVEAAKSSSEDKSGTGDGSGKLKASSETESSSYWKQYRTTQRKERLSVNRSGSSEDVNESSGSAKEDEHEGDAEDMVIEQEPSESSEARPSESTEVATRDADSHGASLSTMPGFELMSSRESDLCQKLGLSPMQYQEIKRALLSESLAQGLLDKEGVNSGKRSIVKIDVQKQGPVLDFMVSAGWISVKSSE